MDIKEEVKQVVICEAKSAFHKGRVVCAVLEQAYKISKSQVKFIKRYVEEWKK